MTVEEWDFRQLCSDGACTGVIGPTGQCKTCGRAAPNWGDERKRGMRSTTDAPPISALAAGAAASAITGSADDDIAPSAPAALGDGIAAGGWSSRQLCSDGSCIGLVGSDGRCRVCGLAATPAPVRTDAEDAEYEDDGDFEDDDEDDDEYEDDDDDDEPDEGDEPGVIQARRDEVIPPIAASPMTAPVAAPVSVPVVAPVATAAALVSDAPRELCSEPTCTGTFESGVCNTCGKERGPA